MTRGSAFWRPSRPRAKRAGPATGFGLARREGGGGRPPGKHTQRAVSGTSHRRGKTKGRKGVGGRMGTSKARTEMDARMHGVTAQARPCARRQYPAIRAPRHGGRKEVTGPTAGRSTARPRWRAREPPRVGTRRYTTRPGPARVAGDPVPAGRCGRCAPRPENQPPQCVGGSPCLTSPLAHKECTL